MRVLVGTKDLVLVAEFVRDGESNRVRVMGCVKVLVAEWDCVVVVAADPNLLHVSAQLLD